jgi:hypothetical protein
LASGYPLDDNLARKGGEMTQGWLIVAASMAGAAPVSAADMLLLQQTVLPDESAPVIMLVDRERVAVAQLRQAAKNGYVLEVMLVGEPNVTLRVTCQDVAAGRQVVDALRPRGVATLDVSGRCWF